MELVNPGFSFLLLVLISTVRGLHLVEVEELINKTLKDFRWDLEERYGLVRRCDKPVVEHGSVECEGSKDAVRPGDLPPGSTCTLHCHAGYIQAIGHHKTTCQHSGKWDIALECEVPLLLVSGGLESSKGPSLEVVSLGNTQGCHDIQIPELPTDILEKKFHNLLYLSPTQTKSPTILVCHGLSDAPKSKCHHWSPGETEWKRHSYPNQGSSYYESMRSLEALTSSYNKKKKFKDATDFQINPDDKKYPNRKVATYAAASVQVGHKVILAGGMVNTKPSHKVVNTLSENDGKDWKFLSKNDRYNEEWFGKGSALTLLVPRSFFCAVGDLEANAFFAFGGFSGQAIESSVELVSLGSKMIEEKYGKNLKNSTFQFDYLPRPRMGHSCTKIPGRNTYIVTGGSENESSPPTESSLLFSPLNNEFSQWRNTGKMGTPRFGHAIVALGDRIVTVGGKTMINPDTLTDTIEEYKYTVQKPSEESSVTDGTFHQISSKLLAPRANFGYALIPPSMFPGCRVEL